MTRSLFPLILLSQYVLSCMGAMSVNLTPGEEFCIAFKTPGTESSRISGSYDVLDEGISLDPVTAVLFDYETEKVVWHSKNGASEGHFSLLNSGKYHLCFGNGSGGYKTEADKKRQILKLQGHPSPVDDDFDYTNDDGLNRRIGFTLRVTPLAGTKMAAVQQSKTTAGMEANAKNVNKAEEQSSKMTDLTYMLRDKLELLLDHQEYIKNREALHRNIVEQTFSMIMKWTVLEAVVLIGVSFAQVYYLKKFFETKRFL